MGKFLNPRRMALIAIFTCILFIQEEALSFIPNVQLTQCLITVYFFTFGAKDTLIIVAIHCLLDNLIFGFSLLYTPAMFVGWFLLVLLLFLFRKFKNNKLILAIVVALHSILYSACFGLVNGLLGETAILSYLIADIPFTIILIVCGFTSTYLLYEPLTKVLNKQLNKCK